MCCFKYSTAEEAVGNTGRSRPWIDLEEIDQVKWSESTAMPIHAPGTFASRKASAVGLAAKPTNLQPGETGNCTVSKDWDQST